MASSIIDASLLDDAAERYFEEQREYLQRLLGTFTLSYAGLSQFYGGLEKQLGAPDPRCRRAMREEHTNREDSGEIFVSPNYNITTTSAIEYAFVADPEAGPPPSHHAGSGKHWPAEAIEMPPGASPRVPMPRSVLEAHRAALSSQLAKHSEQPLSDSEATGARLYTGPTYVKYNAVLRGMSSEVPLLRNDMVEKCCAREVARAYMGTAQKHEPANGATSFDTVCSRHLNLYTSTLFMINSCVVKLSKLTKAAKVYRGLDARGKLPEVFWTANEIGVRGGIEPAFMSTTLDRNVALQYASSLSGSGGGGEGGVSGTIFEVQMGMVDRGADLTTLSQYPHEAEILFGPLTGLEVRSTRVDESTLVVAAHASINLRSLTYDEVIGRRRSILQEMGNHMALDLRTALHEAPSAARDSCVASFETALERGAFSHPAEWYNDDDHLVTALKETVEAKSLSLLQGLRALGRGPSELLGMCGTAISATKRGMLLKEIGCTAKELYLEGGYYAEDLIEFGFSLREMKDVGFTPYHMRQLNFNIRQLMDGGFTSTFEFMQSGFTAKDFKEARWTGLSCMQIGLTPGELLAGGYPKAEIDMISKTGLHHISHAGHRHKQMRVRRGAGGGA